jgi:hypothetical protein
MTRPGTGKSAAARYQEMAAAAAKCAQESKSPRDRAVYLALSKGWASLAEAETTRDREQMQGPRKTKRKAKPNGAG